MRPGHGLADRRGGTEYPLLLLGPAGRGDTAGMPLTPPEIKTILDALESSDWDSATVTVDGVTISVARNGAASVAAVPVPVASAAPAPAVAPKAPAAVAAPTAAPVATSTPAAGGHVITAPSVGVFWRSPRPGLPPFVEVGQTVTAGDTVCIVEMMKLMNNVAADVSGVVTAIHVENAQQVEYGTPLVTITPA